MFIDYFQQHLPEKQSIVIVAPNTELGKKARKFQHKIRALRPDLQVGYGAFIRSDSDSSFSKGNKILDLQGDVKDRDVILIEDYIGMNKYIQSLLLMASE